jgi:alkylation response protein AidB-like acyl-CoA dehydrogenase
MNYVADMRDIRFLLFEVLKLQDLQKFPMFKDYGKDDYDAMLTEAYKFARDVIAPMNEVSDQVGAKFEDGEVILPEVFKNAWKRLSDNGWLGAIQSQEIGGQGLPWVMGQVIHEFFIGSCVAFSLTAGLTEGVISLLQDFGTEEIKAKYAPKLLEGKWSGTMCLTEAGAGSDVGANKATAEKLPNGKYLIQGTKIFITGGDHNLCDASTANVIHAVLARTPDAPAGTKGLSLFVVPKYRVDATGNRGEFNDVKVGRIEHKMGIKGSPTCVLNFGEDNKCEGEILGAELEGMKIMFHMMNEARIMVGVQGLAAAGASYEAAKSYAQERLQGSHILNMKDPKAPKVAIIEHADVRRMLLWQKSVVEGLRTLLYTSAWYADMARSTDDPADKEKYQGYVELLTPVCKAYGSDMGVKACDLAIQVYGGYGYCSEYPVEQNYRDARIAPIYEGTNGIQAMDLAGRKLPMKSMQIFSGYLKEIGTFADKYKAHPGVGKLATKLSDAKNLMAGITMKMMTVAMQDPQYLMLVAYPLLESFGDVIAAYGLVTEAVVADAALTKLYQENGATGATDKKKLVNDNPEAKFYWGKLQSATFFCNNILPNVKTRVEIMSNSDRSSLDVVF